MDIVASILEKSNKPVTNYKPIEVQKHLDLQYDLGLLMAYDENDLDLDKLNGDDKDLYLKQLTRDNTQLLINKIWELPVLEEDDVIKVQLPKRNYKLPREKHVPQPKPLTRWEKFAMKKGITKKKRAKISWDETLQKWLPRYGYQKAKADKEKQWLLEVPDNADPYEDQFEKKLLEKRENIAKNEYQKMRNLGKALRTNLPDSGIVQPTTAKELSVAATIAKASTASVGKFQNRLNNKEELAPGVAKITPGESVKKRKDAYVNSQHEANQNLNVINRILGKAPKLNVQKSVNIHLNKEIEQKKADFEALPEPLKKKAKKQPKPKGGKKPKNKGTAGVHKKKDFGTKRR